MSAASVTSRALASFFLALVVLFYLCLFTSPAVFVSHRDLLEAFLSEEIRFALTLSLLTSACATALCALIGVPAAYALSRYSFRGKSEVESFLDVPIAVPPIVLGTMLLIFFSRNPLGAFINERLIRFVFEVPGIVLAQFAVTCPLTVRLLKEVFDGVPPRYELVARTLGYSELETFLYVTLPAARRGLVAALIFSWSKALGEFGATMMLAGATRFKTETLPIAVYLKMVEADLGGVAAASFILIATACVAATLARRLLVRVPLSRGALWG